MPTSLPKERCERARDQLRRSDTAGVARLVEDGLGRLDDPGNSCAVWGLRLIRADLMRLHGNTQEALEYLDGQEKLCPPTGDDLESLIGLKKTRGYCLGLLGRYALSHDLIQQAERPASNAGMRELQCEVRQCQAMIYYLEEDYASSDRVFRLILAASAELGGWYFRANALWGIGKNLMIQGHHREALPRLEDSLALFESAGVRISMAIVWSEMAVCYLGLGDHRRSMELFESALHIQQEAGMVRSYQVVLAHIGNVYLQRGDYLRAIDHYRRALELARQIQDPTSIEKWSHNIRLAYKRLRESIESLAL